MQNIRFDPVSNHETLELTFESFDENGDTVDFTGATISLAIRDMQTKSTLLTADTDDGITIDTTVFTVRFEDSEMEILQEKEYEIACTFVLGGYKTQLFVGPLSIYEGGP